MRAHEVAQLVEVLVVSLGYLVRRRAALGEQTGGRRFGLLRCSAAERARQGRRLPSERAGGVRAPPSVL